MQRLLFGELRVDPESPLADEFFQLRGGADLGANKMSEPSRSTVICMVWRLAERRSSNPRSPTFSAVNRPIPLADLIEHLIHQLLCGRREVEIQRAPRYTN